MFSVITGFIAGTIHVFSGPDHLAAIAPLAAEKKQSAWKIGFRWGFGHTGGVFIIGIAALIFREVIPVDIISSYSERFIGIILITIGLWGLQKVFIKKVHSHEHTHEGKRYYHIHLNTGNPETINENRHTHTAFIVGIFHGLAGSSHLLGILPALAMPTKTDTVFYLVFFGIGTVLAMTLFSAFVGSVSGRFFNVDIRFYKNLLASMSVASILIGGIWLIA